MKVTVKNKWKNVEDEMDIKSIIKIEINYEHCLEIIFLHHDGIRETKIFDSNLFVEVE